MELTVLAMLLALLIGIPAGVLVAGRAGWVRRISNGFVIAAISIPDFWLGIMLVLLFTGVLRALPPTGFVPLSQDPVQNIRFMILPVGLMYAGQLAEVAATAELFAGPRHPYTRALLAALPTRAHGPGQLPVIPGQIPDLTRPPSGCRFKDRCPSAMTVCDTEPALVTAPGGHAVACWLHADANADGAGVGAGPDPGRRQR